MSDLTETQIEDRVRRIIVEHLDCDPKDVKWDAWLVDDLGADDEDTNELVMGFEEEFDVEIFDFEDESDITVGDIITCVAGKTGVALVKKRPAKKAKKATYIANGDELLERAAANEEIDYQSLAEASLAQVEELRKKLKRETILSAVMALALVIAGLFYADFRYREGFQDGAAQAQTATRIAMQDDVWTYVEHCKAVYAMSEPAQKAHCVPIAQTALRLMLKHALRVPANHESQTDGY
jgi:acyl carrier protein